MLNHKSYTCNNSVNTTVWRYWSVSSGENATKSDLDRLDKIIRDVGRVIGETLHNIEPVYNTEFADKSMDIMEDDSHPLHCVRNKFIIPRSGRLRVLLALTSFVPRAINIVIWMLVENNPFLLFLLLKLVFYVDSYFPCSYISIIYSCIYLAYSL